MRGRNPFHHRRLATSRAALERSGSEPLDGWLGELPLVTKADLVADQEAHPPYGSNLTFPLADYIRIHRTSGTTTGRALFWLDTRDSWRWFVGCWERVYRGVALRADDSVFLPFSFGPFIGFWGAFEAAQALGRRTLPAGGMTSVARLRHLVDHRATVVAVTPTYALHLAEVARAERIDLAASSVRALIVAGEPGGHIRSTRAQIEELWGARVFDHHGMTEIGCVSYEIDGGPGGLHINEDEFIVEVLEPASDRPVADGTTGELVLTNLGRTGSPLVRYRTGDLVRWVAEDPEEARADGTHGSGRLDGGILGRVDDMFFIRGNNVYASAIEAVIREFAEVAEYRLRVLESGRLSALEVELEVRSEERCATETASLATTTDTGGGDSDAADPRGLVARVARTIQDRLGFRARVRVVPTGTLPRFEFKAHRIVREPAPPTPNGT